MVGFHLSGNPGVTPEAKEYLLSRIHGKNNENYEI